MYVQQHALTAIATVLPSRVPALRQTLAALQREVDQGGPGTPFASLAEVHLARWFVLDNLKDPDGKPYAPMVGLSTNFDGDMDAHLERLASSEAIMLDAVGEHCEGYPAPNARTPAARKAFLKRCFESPKLFWGSKFGHTARQIQQEGALRDAIQRFLQEQAVAQQWPSKSASQIKEQIVRFVRASPEWAWALEPTKGPSFGWKVKYYGKITVILLLALALLPVLALFLGIWILIGRHFEKVDDRIRATQPPQTVSDERYRELVSVEDRIFQNQLTVYGTIKKPYWFKRTTLRLALSVFALNGAYRSTKGKLSGIPTIHFARWVMFNQDRNVMFLSNYNGNWENYLSEFIERAANAMNVSFGNMVGYPQVRWFIKGGAHDEQQFKTVVRNNQYPSQVYYSAYPNLSVRNILNNAEIRKGLSAQASEAEAQAWLLRLH
jgi:hypothetical protein